MLLFVKSLFFTSFIFMLFSCQSTFEVDENIQHVPVPENWQQNAENLSVENDWLAQLRDTQAQELVNKALASNYQLKAKAYNVDIRKQQVIASGSQLWPSLDLSLQAGRRTAPEPANYANSNSLGLNLSYELDIWGKLSDFEKQANLLFLAEQASYKQSKQQLVADVVVTWFNVIEAQQLLGLYQQRASSVKQNLDIIESGYSQGLNNALDVYLSRNELNNELSRVANQISVNKTEIRKLERLTGDYPKGELLVSASLPLLNNDIPLGIPAELVSRKPSLLASWNQLLAKDASLAYAHKARFPSIQLSASYGTESTDFSDLLSGSALGWSLLGGVTAPLFNAGRLSANEEKARYELKQSEQLYLDSLYGAFSDVENAITIEASLKHSYQTMVSAQENAAQAQILSFEQYQSGLVSYTTVLDAQKRAFDAQATLINIKKQLVVNRIKLHLALGGDFSTPQAEEGPSDE